MAKQRKRGSTNTQESSASGNNAPTLLVNNPSKWQSWWVRVRLSVVMIVGFGVIIWIGHWGLIGLLLGLQIFGYRELYNIRSISLFGQTDKQKAKLPYSSPWLDILFFFTFQYFFYGLAIFEHFTYFFSSAPPFLKFLVEYHLFISFSFMMVCLVSFVGTLERSQYLQQFHYLTWTMMCLLLLVPSNFHIINIFNGLFWFILPVSLIICNDITAYIWGFFFGRTSLIKLSPKKTWEGFIGAFISTVIFAYFISGFLGKYDIFTCPKTELFGAPYDCPSQYLFKKHYYPVPEVLHELFSVFGLNWDTWACYPVQWYAVGFGVFASTIAPFGGFLASGFKRAYGFKDFGDLIPGHGGIIDRMDCQVMMSAFTYVFFLTFVDATHRSTYGVVNSILALPLHQQLDLLSKLQETLQPITHG